MYSPLVVDKRLHAARKAGKEFQRLPRVRSIEVALNLEKLRRDAQGNLLPSGGLVRPLDKAEREFIESERLLCACDFSYYLERYHTVEIDPGVDRGEGIGPARMLESQEQFLRVVGNREEEVHREWAKHKFTAGILLLAHKCRQVAFTSMGRAITVHRMNFYPGTRAFAGTLEPDGCGELYKRDKLALDHLPFWLSPGEPYPDVKDQELGFLNSRLRYQPENQKTGIGVGTQIDVSHLTEVPLWRYPYQIDYSFAPALPKGRMTFHMQEGTANGSGYWQDVTENCRKRLPGYESWTYLFVPWWFNRFKYRMIVPDSFSLDNPRFRLAREHAELIERTSPEFNNGTTYRPSREQIYWWWSERTRQARDGNLASFLNNFPATPEQSFTNWSEGALPVETLEEMEFELREPVPYGVMVA
jgi:hypothetical protein